MPQLGVKHLVCCLITQFISVLHSAVAQVLTSVEAETKKSEFICILIDLKLIELFVYTFRDATLLVATILLPIIVTRRNAFNRDIQA
jgi:hypothetical protein